MPPCDLTRDVPPLSHFLAALEAYLDEAERRQAAQGGLEPPPGPRAGGPTRRK